MTTELTDRELNVLRHMAAGWTNREIGKKMVLAEDTVKSHQRRMFAKLKARNRTHAVDIGHRIGLLTSDSWRVVRREAGTTGWWAVTHDRARQESGITKDHAEAVVKCLTLLGQHRDGLPKSAQRVRVKA